MPENQDELENSVVFYQDDPHPSPHFLNLVKMNQTHSKRRTGRRCQFEWPEHLPDWILLFLWGYVKSKFI